MSDSTPDSPETPAGRAGRRPGRVGRAARRAPIPRAVENDRGPPAAGAVVGLAGAVHRRVLGFSAVRAERLCAPRRVRHGALHVARARSERRRRLGRPARPRVRRLLRDRRVHVCLPRLESVRHPPADDRFRARGRRRRRPDRAHGRPPVAQAERRLPRDRHVVLPAAVPDAGHERRQCARPRHHRRAVRDPQRRSVQLLRSLAGRGELGRVRGVVSLRRPWRSSRSCSWRFGSSTTHGRVARGARSARIRSRPRRWACP